MQLRVMGTEFSHKRGEFCRKAEYEDFVICNFETPFVYLFGGKMREGAAGDILINSPGQTVYHGPRPDMNEGFKNDWIHIRGDDIKALIEKYPLPIGEAFSVGEKYFLREYMNKLLVEYHAGEEGSPELIDSTVTEMIIRIHRAYNGFKIKEGSDAVAAVRREIIRNPERNWRLYELAEKSGYSVSRFSELYRSMFDCSPIDDVIAQRIKLAKRLLSSGQASVTKIAETCGFSSINYFSKTFKAATGRTPSEYIKK